MNQTNLFVGLGVATLVVAGGYIAFEKTKAPAPPATPVSDQQERSSRVSREAVSKPNGRRESVRTVEGVVLSIYRHPKGHLFVKIRENGSANVFTAPIFSSLSYDASRLTTNSLVSVTGKEEYYKGEHQIVPRYASDIRIVTSATRESTAWTSIRAIDSQWIGREVVLQGVATETFASRGHLFFTLRGEEGAIRCVLFKADTAELADRKALVHASERQGSSISLKGTVDLYRGKLEVKVKQVFI